MCENEAGTTVGDVTFHIRGCECLRMELCGLEIVHSVHGFVTFSCTCEIKVTL